MASPDGSGGQNEAKPSSHPAPAGTIETFCPASLALFSLAAESRVSTSLLLPPLKLWKACPLAEGSAQEAVWTSAPLCFRAAMFND